MDFSYYNYYNRAMFRAAIVLLLIVLYLIIGLPALGVIWLIRKKDRKRANHLARAGLGFICKLVIKVSGTHLKVEGIENIPQNQGVLFVGNHTSYFDILIALAQPTPIFGFIAKMELKRIPSLRIWMKCIDCIFLDREDIRAAMEVIKTATENIKQGISVFIFPEGTRFHDDTPREFKGGSFKIATRTNCPIIPVSINRCDDILERHFPRITPANVTLKYGAPIYPDRLSAEEKKNIANYVHGIVTSMYLDS